MHIQRSCSIDSFMTLPSAPQPALSIHCGGDYSASAAPSGSNTVSSISGGAAEAAAEVFESPQARCAL